MALRERVIQQDRTLRRYPVVNFQLLLENGGAIGRDLAFPTLVAENQEMVFENAVLRNQAKLLKLFECKFSGSNQTCNEIPVSEQDLAGLR